MSEPCRPRVKLLIFALAALVLTTSFGVGRLVAKHDGDTAGAAPVPSTQSSSSRERYKIPVSLSQPTRGAADALVTVVEWCDVSGEACRASDATVQALLREYAGRMRHVFRHFPAQASPQSMLAHEFARIAHEQGGKFWQARAALLASDEPVTMMRLEAIATRLDMDFQVFTRAIEAHNHAGYVGADGLFAGKFAVTDAPSFFVNGRRLRGEATRARLKQLIDEELAHAGKLVAQGVARDRLYDTITEHGLWQATPSRQPAKSP